MKFKLSNFVNFHGASLNILSAHVFGIRLKHLETDEKLSNDSNNSNNDA